MDTTATGAQLQPDDAAQIRGFVAPWSQACLDRDWDALVAMCTDDIVFSPPGEPKVVGAGVRTWLDTFPVVKEFKWGFDKIEVSGDLATGVGQGEMTLEIDGQDVAMSIEFADIFRRGDDGTWRFAHVIWNQNEPAG